MKIKYREANKEDVNLLAEMNKRLIADEGHSNPMNVDELTKRMMDFLRGNYTAYLLNENKTTIGYCLFRNDEDFIYIRQLFIERAFRRKGYGRSFIQWLKDNVWSGQKLRIEVLKNNLDGMAFWKGVGFVEYSITMEMN